MLSATIRTRGFAISARHTIRTVRSTRSSLSSNAPALFAREDTVEEKLGKLRELLAPDTRGDDEFELVAELLSLPNSASILNLSPQRKREMLLEALLHELEALARNRPVLMVFEDAHWIDPTSRELLDLILDRVSRLPILVIITFRSEFQHAWSGQPVRGCCR